MNYAGIIVYILTLILAIWFYVVAFRRTSDCENLKFVIRNLREDVATLTKELSFYKKTCSDYVDCFDKQHERSLAIQQIMKDISERENMELDSEQQNEQTTNVVELHKQSC